MRKPIQPDAHPPNVGGCTEAWSEKLFWYVNETLEAKEADQVEAHLAACEACRGEAAELRALQETVRERAAKVPEPSEAVYDRVMAQIDAYEARRFRLGRLWGRIVNWLAPLELLWQPALRPAMAVAGLIILVQAVAIAGLLTMGGPTSPYRTLTGGPPTAAPGPTVQVAFHGEASEQTIRTLLREVDATIISGPSALGTYTVALPAGLRDEAAIDNIVDRLRARAEVVRFAERLP